MAINIAINKIQFVRESCKRYDLSRTISGPEDVVAIARDVFCLQQEAQEVMLVIMLSQKNQFTGVHEVSRGTVSGTLIHPRELFKPIILSNATAFIMVHNHPSGDTEPSKEDCLVTARLVEAGKLMDIPCLDHVIVGGGGYTSLKEQGIL